MHPTMLYWSLYLHWMSICKIPWSEITTNKFMELELAEATTAHSTYILYSSCHNEWKFSWIQLSGICVPSLKKALSVSWAPPHLSETSPVLPFKSFHCLSDWWWPFLILALSNPRDQEDHRLNASSFNATFLQVTDDVTSLALCPQACLKLLNILQQTSHSSSILPNSK